MTHARSIQCNSFVSMALITAVVAATGCTESAQPSSDESVATVATSSDYEVITDSEALSGSGLSLRTVAFQRTEHGDKILSSDWTQTAAGEWTTSADGVATTIKVTPLESEAPQGVADPSLLVTCNLGIYIGAGSPFGRVGAAAVGRVECLDAPFTFLITATICTDVIPACVTVAGNVTHSPGSPPALFGVVGDGTPGTSCSGSVVFNPPGSGLNRVFPCG